MQSQESRKWTTACLGLVVALSWVDVTQAQTARRVELELVTNGPVPPLSQQDWLRRLASAGVTKLRIRAMRGGDRLGVETRGTPEMPYYVVTGLLAGSGDVQVGGRRYRPTEAAQLASWLDEVARLGPVENRPPITAFGLTAAEFQRVHDDLARPVGSVTQGRSRAEVVRDLSRRLRLPIRVDPSHLAAFQQDTVVEDLSKLSCGTALACVARPLGMCLVPREQGGRAVEYSIIEAKPGVKAWPIGWQSERNDRETLPALYEFLTVNVDGVPVTDVLKAVSGRIDAPILLDHNALARHGVEPEQVVASFPSSRTWHAKLLQRVLSQAKLKSEVRLDEAGKPFLWVTTMKPL